MNVSVLTADVPDGHFLCGNKSCRAPCIAASAEAAASNTLSGNPNAAQVGFVALGGDEPSSKEAAAAADFTPLLDPADALRKLRLSQPPEPAPAFPPAEDVQQAVPGQPAEAAGDHVWQDLSWLQGRQANRSDVQADQPLPEQAARAKAETRYLALLGGLGLLGSPQASDGRSRRGSPSRRGEKERQARARRLCLTLHGGTILPAVWFFPLTPYPSPEAGEIVQFWGVGDAPAPGWAREGQWMRATPPPRVAQARASG